MKLLLIDTTADRILVATFVDGTIVSKFGSGNKGTTSSSIIPFIDGVLTESKLELQDIDCVFALVGPGSFTGIRIGVCTANALSFGAGIAKSGLNVFDGFGDGLAVIPSRRGYCYYRLNDEYGEKSIEEVNAFDDFSYRYMESESGREVSDDEYISTLFTKAVWMVEHNELKPLEPMYLKKSQAERMREGKKE